MGKVSFEDFQKAEQERFNAACTAHGCSPADFLVLGLTKENDNAPMFVVRVEYLPTRKTLQYLCGESMSWLVSFEIDIRKGVFTTPA